MKTREIAVYFLLLAGLLLLSREIAAQAAPRELHWDALDVEAHLDAGGVLDVIERHTMVFTGDWNGGERVFNVRPRQKLEFLGIDRFDPNSGSLHPLQQTAVPNNVDEFTWSDSRTLRWRSRRLSDPQFANTKLIYVLHYKLSGILLKEDARYRINHDFAFPNRTGSIALLTVDLSLDPAWQPTGEFRNRYSAGPIGPGQGFVLNIPLRYSGSAAPLARDTRRPPAVIISVLVIFAGFSLLVVAFLLRERSLGRFVPIDTSGIDSAWIEKNILSFPAEVVGATWDGRIGTPEVVALIARMTAEGKLESNVVSDGSMTLRLKVDRDTLNDHERALVDGLFFNRRTETSTKDVKQHYKSKGFDPASVIKPELKKYVTRVMPAGNTRVGRLPGIALLLASAALLAWNVYSDPANGGAAVAIAVFSLILGAVWQIPGWVFRSRMDWGMVAAAFAMLPVLAVSLGTASFLWFIVGSGELEVHWTMIGALAAVALCISNATINGMKSRQSREAIAFRKRLVMGRRFFFQELQKAAPDLRDGWYPWLLAFGLSKQVDVWSTHHASTTTSTSTWSPGSSQSSSNSSSNSPSTPASWSGGGGFSGGAGASGAWVTAAAGMAVGVASPGSSSSDGGGSSSSSSSGGSSGGGGGGGW